MGEWALLNYKDHRKEFIVFPQGHPNAYLAGPPTGCICCNQTYQNSGVVFCHNCYPHYLKWHDLLSKGQLALAESWMCHGAYLKSLHPVMTVGVPAVPIFPGFA